ncbi:MAG: carboxypeptidase-like regulatory domain-containing protein [Spirosomataceae bacterium]|jgi:hypothetical protein
MRILFSILLILNLSFTFAQTPCFQIFDNSENPVSYSSVLVKNRNMGQYSDQDGKFCLEWELSENDIIVFSAVGFQKKEVPLKELLKQKKIYLDQRIENLAEVIVKPSKREIMKLGYFRPNVFVKQNSYGPNSIMQIGTFIENPSKEVNGLIRQVIVGVDNYEKNAFKSFKLRVRFFENTANNQPGQLDLIHENILANTDNNKKEVVFDLKENAISMPERGIWVTIESLGFYEKDGSFRPNKFGESGRATYRKTNPQKIKKIDSLAPHLFMIENKTKVLSLLKTFNGTWIPLWNHGKKDMVPMIGLKVEY